MCKDGVLYVIYMVYVDPIWILNDVQDNMGELWNLLRGHRELPVDSRKELLEDMGAGVGTQ